MRKCNFLFFFTCWVMISSVFSQEVPEALTGVISFVTSTNVYVKFESTYLISVGDSLLLQDNNFSCLVVTNKSSTSCVCSVLPGCAVEKGKEVIFIPRAKPVEKSENLSEKLPGPDLQTLILTDEEVTSLYNQEIRARVSASSYSTLSNTQDDRHRLMSRLSIDANHINDSPFSFQTYMNYRHILEQESSSSLPQNNFLRIYNLAVQYEATPTLSVVLGRQINPKVSSLGAIDGLQAEKQLGQSFVGILAGSRPDIFDYGYNPDLLEYGAYYGLNTDSKQLYSQTTVGVVEQRGNGEIDRRYAFLQHSSTLSNNFNLFASAEMDIFSKINFTTKNDLRLTNLYVSGRYRFTRKLNLMVSYDSRKRIIYYETFKSDIERLLDDDLARQGIRARLNFRPMKYAYAGVSYSKRFQSDEQNRSDNYYGYFSLSRTPYIGGRTGITLNRNESNYLISNIASLRHSRSFLRNRLFAEGYYRLVHYEYANTPDPLLQHFAGTNITYNITRNLMFSLSGEYSTYKGQNYLRFYSRIVQRFYSKKNKK